VKRNAEEKQKGGGLKTHQKNTARRSRIVFLGKEEKEKRINRGPIARKQRRGKKGY